MMVSEYTRRRVANRSTELGWDVEREFGRATEHSFANATGVPGLFGRRLRRDDLRARLLRNSWAGLGPVPRPMFPAYRRNVMKALSAILASLIAVVALTACNTMNGLGRDIERGGEKIQDSTKKTGS